MARYDVIVLGGGIIGCSLAEELARRGRRVCVVERGTVGCEASTAAAGVLSAQTDLERPGALFELCQASRRLYPAWVRHLERQSGLDVGYHEDGILYLALTSAGAEQMAHRVAWQRRAGFRAERWLPHQVRAREPFATEQIRAGFFFPTEAQLDNVALMRALSLTCRKAGVTLLERTEFHRLSMARARVVAVETSRAYLRAPIVVDCLGSWAAAGDESLPIRPARGQILAFDAPPRLLHHVVMSEFGYGVQRRDGSLLIGSTVEFVGFDHHVTGAGMQQVLSGFHRMMKPEALAQSHVRDFWAGLRPHSQDGLPVLGPTSTEGLYVAGGHFRHGILLAPVTARLMSAVILGTRPAMDLSPFLPTRLS